MSMMMGVAGTHQTLTEMVVVHLILSLISAPLPHA